MKPAVKQQQGALLLSAVILIVVVGFLVTVITLMSTASSRATADQIESAESFYIMQAGLERGKYALFAPTLTDRTACASITGAGSLQNVSFSNGVFSLSAALTGPMVTSLSTAINNSTTVIPVSSTAGLSTQGRVVIDAESIDYTGTSTSAATCGTAPCLTGATRGAAGTTAYAHPSGEAVGQYQCNVTSEAGVPVLTPTSSVRAKDEAQANSTLQYAVTVGDDSGGSARFYGFNLTSNPNAWTQLSTTAPSSDYNAVYAVNYNDIWAVGDSGRISHYNGTSWSLFQTVAPVTTLWGVTCVNGNDCWAVGSSGRIFHYNGATWTLAVTLSGTLRAVTCVIDNSIGASPPYRCFAVGLSGGSGRMFTYVSSAASIADWSAMTIPILTRLYGATCAASNDCWAVGSFSTTATAGRIIHYNGTSWSAAASTGQRIFDVDCVGSNFCMAVARNGWVYQYNGTTWSSGVDIGSTIRSVGCFNTKDCWASGNSAKIYHFDNGSWSEFVDFGGFTFRGMALVGKNNNPQSFWQTT